MVVEPIPPMTAAEWRKITLQDWCDHVGFDLHKIDRRVLAALERGEQMERRLRETTMTVGPMGPMTAALFRDLCDAGYFGCEDNTESRTILAALEQREQLLPVLEHNQTLWVTRASGITCIFRDSPWKVFDVRGPGYTGDAKYDDPFDAITAAVKLAHSGQ